MPRLCRQVCASRPARALGAAGLVALLALCLLGAPVPAAADEADGGDARVLGEVETAVRMYFPAGPPEGGGGGDGETEAPQKPAQDEGVSGAAAGSQSATVGQAAFEGEGAETGIGLIAAGGSGAPVSWALAPLRPGTWPMALTGALMAAVAAALAAAAARQGQ